MISYFLGVKISRCISQIHKKNENHIYASINIKYKPEMVNAPEGWIRFFNTEAETFRMTSLT